MSTTDDDGPGASRDGRPGERQASEKVGKRQTRGWVASRVDELTFAAVVVLLLVTIAAFVHLGGAAARDRIGCALNDHVNQLLAYPRPCH